jgi:hypothetical protein
MCSVDLSRRFPPMYAIMEIICVFVPPVCAVEYLLQWVPCERKPDI